MKRPLGGRAYKYRIYLYLMNLNSRKVLIIGVLLAFLANTFGPICPIACSAEGENFRLPAPGVMVHLSPTFSPSILKGIKVHPDNPFRFDFILDTGDDVSLRGASLATKQSQQEQLKQESTKLIKYFLASLTIPEKDLWVNLSPYEKDRIVPESFGQTEMGRDLLAEDYMLKQITASLIYPEDEIGKKFWKRIYEEAAKKYGTTNIPVNTFNKVWIVPEKAVVYENAKAGTAYVVESKLKGMLEQDYLALSKNECRGGSRIRPITGPTQDRPLQNDVNALGSQIVREIVIPELTKEVNEDKNFAQLRQVYNSLILATWYKKKIKDSILAQVYADKNKVAGVNIDDPQEKEKIYERYLQAFKKGAYNYIKEEIDPVTQETMPRKYFSGGVQLWDVAMTVLGTDAQITDFSNKDLLLISTDFSMITQNHSDAVKKPFWQDSFSEKYSLDKWSKDLNLLRSQLLFNDQELISMVQGFSRNELIALDHQAIGENTESLNKDILRYYKDSVSIAKEFNNAFYWVNVLRTLGISKKSSVVEILPGTGLQIPIALARTGFTGKYIQVDKSDVLKKREQVLTKGLSKSMKYSFNTFIGGLDSFINRSRGKYDVVIGNHTLDDLLTNDFVNANENIFFGQWYTYPDQYARVWSSIIQEGQRSRINVLEMALRIMDCLKPGGILIMKQYPSSFATYYKINHEIEYEMNLFYEFARIMDSLGFETVNVPERALIDSPAGTNYPDSLIVFVNRRNPVHALASSDGYFDKEESIFNRYEQSSKFISFAASNLLNKLDNSNIPEESINSYLKFVFSKHEIINKRIADIAWKYINDEYTDDNRYHAGAVVSSFLKYGPEREAEDFFHEIVRRMDDDREFWRNGVSIIANAINNGHGWVKNWILQLPGPVQAAIKIKNGLVNENELLGFIKQYPQKTIDFLEVASYVSRGEILRNVQIRGIVKKLIDDKTKEMNLNWRKRALKADYIALFGKDDVRDIIESMQNDREDIVRHRMGRAFVSQVKNMDQEQRISIINDLLEDLLRLPPKRTLFMISPAALLIESVNSYAVKINFVDRIISICLTSRDPSRKKLALKLLSLIAPFLKEKDISRSIDVLIREMEDVNTMVQQEAFLGVVNRGLTRFISNKQLVAILSNIQPISKNEILLLSWATYVPMLVAFLGHQQNNVIAKTEDDDNEPSDEFLTNDTGGIDTSFNKMNNSERKDKAMATKKDPGGIDLTHINMNLQTQNSGEGIKFHLDPAQLAQLQNAPGFVPVIINIQPMTNLRTFLGLADNQSSQQLASL